MMEIPKDYRLRLDGFCAPESRYQLARPFSSGGYTYATNGRVCLRLPRREDAAEADEKQVKIVEKIDQWLNDCATQPLTPIDGSKLPQKLPAIHCEDCRGTGRQHPDCECCECECYECDGKGEEEKWRLVDFENVIFSEELIRLILARLPNIKLCISDIGNNNDKRLFTFSGREDLCGDGLIMPMSRGVITSEEVIDGSTLVGEPVA